MSRARTPEFLDSEEQDLIESFEAAIDSGDFQPSPPAVRAAASQEWQARVENAAARKAITLRLQTRDIQRLKTIARRRGMPYQTLLSSVLHQFAEGTLRET